MSPRQFGTLKFIMTHEVTLENVGNLSMVTFGSLAHRGWINRVGHKIELTKAGYEAYETYSRASANFRSHDTGITERVGLMLHISNLHTMKKTG